jgi:hypothetical protein
MPAFGLILFVLSTQVWQSSASSFSIRVLLIIFVLFVFIFILLELLLVEQLPVHQPHRSNPSTVVNCFYCLFLVLLFLFFVI